jgi:hypothetical protein
MTKRDESLKQLAEGLKATRAATAELTLQLRKIQRAEKTALSKVTRACVGGQCTQDAGAASGARAGMGESPGQVGTNVTRGLAGTVRSAMAGDFARALQGVFANLARSIGGDQRRRRRAVLDCWAAIGGRLNLLSGRLFQRRRRGGGQHRQTEC